MAQGARSNVAGAADPLGTAPSRADPKPQRGSSVDEASWEQLMVLRSEPGSGLKAQRACAQARSKTLAVRRLAMRATV